MRTKFFSPPKLASEKIELRP